MTAKLLQRLIVGAVFLGSIVGLIFIASTFFYVLGGFLNKDLLLTDLFMTVAFVLGGIISRAWPDSADHSFSDMSHVARQQHISELQDLDAKLEAKAEGKNPAR